MFAFMHHHPWKRRREEWFIPLDEIDVGEELFRGTHVTVDVNRVYRTHEVVNRGSIGGAPVAVRTRYIFHNAPDIESMDAAEQMRISVSLERRSSSETIGCTGGRNAQVKPQVSFELPPEEADQSSPPLMRRFSSVHSQRMRRLSQPSKATSR